MSATVRELTGCPAALTASASCRVDFNVHRNADSGSPRESRSTNASITAISSGSATVAFFRPAPARRAPANRQPRRGRLASKLAHARLDRRAGRPRRNRQRVDATTAKLAGFRRQHKSTLPLIKMRAKHCEPASCWLDIDHTAGLRLAT